MAEDGASGRFDPFSGAEVACAAAIEALVAEGGRELYDRYIHRKSFSYASGVATDNLCAELLMCHVQCDTAPLRPAAPSSGTAAAAAAGDGAAEGASGLTGVAAVEADAAAVEASAAAAAAAAADASACSGAGAASSSSASPAAAAPAPLALKRSSSSPSGASGSSGVRRESPSSIIVGAPMIPEDDGWALEPEPPRCNVDSWARACVPIRKRFISKEELHGLTKRKSKAIQHNTTQSSGASSRAASRTGQPQNENAEFQPKVANIRAGAAAEQAKSQVIPLVTERPDDEEEAALRDIKDREARRYKDEEARVQRKAAEEAEQAARMVQMGDQMKNKPHTYDSDGNIMWVQPPAVNKLPNAAPSMAFHCNKETFAENQQAPMVPHPPAAAAKRNVARKVHKAPSKPPEFPDGFKKLHSQQPSMLEAMKMNAGVMLMERGEQKYGADPVPASGAGLSRKEYEAMVQREFNGPSEDHLDTTHGVTTQRNSMANVLAAASASAPEELPTSRGIGGVLAGGDAVSASAAARAAAAGGSAGAAGAAAGAGGGEGSGGVGAGAVGVALGAGTDVGAGAATPRQLGTTSFRVVRGEDINAQLVPQPPGAPRAAKPVPPIDRRVQMKREALGFNLSSRERPMAGTASRYPNCAAKPPLGATMGHGLAPAGVRHEEYYFPASPPVALADVASRTPSKAGGSVLPSPRSAAAGLVVSKNPELKNKLFPR
eukprot:TRINITY_DN6440_c1_g1_i1.p1 TRINITY_DN6440_c1_g1~~TRINITY_DN6440_c1_g1_i1.p1  ORF type:complete len:719 (+),score=182.80 TRINITY_DN6440_c1_g1_i1:106-2262(+)